MIYRDLLKWDGTSVSVSVEGDLFSILPDSADVSARSPLSRTSAEYILLPGLADVHVHLREPGFSYKETIRTGTRAAAAGGFTSVCAMPNLSPAPDTLPHLQEELERIERDACIEVKPFGCITMSEKGEQLADLEALAPFVAGFSDDGVGLESDERMEEAMRRAKALRKPIAAHCEYLGLVNGGCIHDGEYARTHNLPGISSESEWRMVERDLRLVSKIGCAYHVCHVSTKESVRLIREAKAAGLPVTCETAPHYLLMTDRDLRDEGRFKMNPPLREEADRDALLCGLADGTVDMVATDHAPHSAEEKAAGLLKSRMGVVGLETSLPLLYDRLVRTGILPLERLLDAMCFRPRKIFGLEEPGLVLFDPNASYEIQPEKFRSMGRATPFAGWQTRGKVLITARQGKVVYKADQYEEAE